jgi:hypothetical protein
MIKKDTDNRKNVRLLLLLTAAAFCCIVAAIVLLRCREVLLFAPPKWVSWQEKEIAQPPCTLVISGKRAALYSDLAEEPAWQSVRDLKVQDGFITDIDRDGDQELILLLWKRGRFGKHRPFWVDSDEITYSQHIFIYDIQGDGTVRNKWFASDIGRELTRIKLMEKNSSIILTEGRDGENLLWSWESFGLKNLSNEVSFIAFGDNIIHQSIIDYARHFENGSFDFLYKPFLEEIRDADIAVIQAETVLVDREADVSGYPFFGSPIAVGEAVRDAGFDVAVCANNHALDKGMYGIDVTSSFYKDNNMTVLGIQGSKEKSYRPYEIISRNGISIALFSYTYGTNEGDVSSKYPYAVHFLPGNEKEEKALLADLKKARESADFVVAFVHWGDEYKSTVSDSQRHFADLFAQGGTDVLIGSHPHVVQETELLTRPDGGEMLTFYSLGNFRADQKGIRGDDPEADTGIGAEALFTLEHTYDGVRVKSWDIRSVDAYWKSR